MPFEPELQGLFHGTLSTTARDTQEVPSTIFSLDDSWQLYTEWSVQGSLVPLLTGQWEVQIYLEAIGSGPDLSLPKTTIDFAAGEQEFEWYRCIYNLTRTIPPGFLTQAGLYRLVTVLTSVTQQGKPSPLVGLHEGNILQFYVK